MAWHKCDEMKPLASGRYWVYPYVTLEGRKIVFMATFTKGEWDKSGRPQEYHFWKKIEVPQPPIKRKSYYGSN